MSGGPGFTIPSRGSAAPELPPELARKIEESVKRFEDRWNGFGMLMLARTNGWITDYRKEVTAIALEALRLGKG